MNGLKTVFFDLEVATIGNNIPADQGYIICGVLKERGKKPVLYSNWGHKPLWDDKVLTQTLITELNKADVLISWNGILFDKTWLNTRAFLHGLEPLSDIAHKDGMLTARWRFHFGSNRMDNVAKMLAIYDPAFKVKKIPLPLLTWVRAMTGDYELRIGV